MKPYAAKLLRVARSGAICGLVFIIAVILFGPHQSSDERGIYGTCLYWINAPLLWLIEWMSKRENIRVDNPPVAFAALFVYWALLGAILAILISHLRSKLSSRGQSSK